MGFKASVIDLVVFGLMMRILYGAMVSDAGGKKCAGCFQFFSMVPSEE